MRTPPQDLEAESGVLAAMLQSDKAIAEATEALTTDDFANPRARQVFDAIVHLWTQGDAVDALKVADALAHGRPEKRAEIRDFIVELLDAHPLAKVAKYAEIVSEAATCRRLISACSDISDAAYSQPENVEALVSEAEWKILSVSRETMQDEPTKRLAEYLAADQEEIEEIGKTGGLLGISSGLPAVDRRVHGWEPGQLVVIGAQTGHGKGGTPWTKVLTPTGWTTLGQIRVGDRVIGADGNAHRVAGVYPRGRLPIYRVSFSDKSSVLCDADHLWRVHHYYDKHLGLPPKVLSTQELMDLGVVQLPGGRRKWQIPMVAPVEFDEQPLPLDPYLLGVLIGDGCLTNGPAFCVHDAEIVENVRALLPDGHVLTTSDGKTWRISNRYQGNRVQATLRALGLADQRAEHKFIPTAYLYSSVESRVALLQGLMDTDGSVRRLDNSLEFGTASKQLIENVLELVRSLGGRAVIRTSRRFYQYKGERREGQLGYRLTVSLPSQIAPFRLTRKAEIYRTRLREPLRVMDAIEPAGEEEVICIAVDSPDSLYVTDDYIVTHNTSLLQHFAVTAARLGKRVLFVSLEMSSKEIRKRIYSSVARVPHDALRTGKLQEKGWNLLSDGMAKIAGWTLEINARKNQTTADIAADARRVAARHQGLDLLVVDYLQYVTPQDFRVPREQQVGRIAKELKDIAGLLGCPIITAVQLNDKISERKDKRPIMGDIRESRGIEHTADIILFGYWGWRHDPEQSMNDYKVIIAKHRQGMPDFLVDCYWEPQYYSIREHDRRSLRAV